MLERGIIDRRRYVQIAKSLSKQVFFSKIPGNKLNTAVVIVIDESGSMSNFLEVQKLAICLGETLDALGVPFEIVGTTTLLRGDELYKYESLGFTRYNAIVYRHYKDFNESWTTVRPRITQTSSYLNNIDNEAVDYAAKLLAKRTETRRIVFSLSDGEPCAGQGLGQDAEFGVNLRRVCENVRKAGIEVYGFGIGTTRPEAYYGKEWFLHLPNIRDGLSEVFFRKFAEIITSGRVRCCRKAA